MRTIHCECCESALISPTEIATGLCARHQQSLADDKCFAGVCWTCGRITIIEEVPKKLIGILTEKYIFTAQCSKCTGDPKDDVKWITVEKFIPPQPLTIDEKGKLVGVTNHEKSKDRDTVMPKAETELHSSGQGWAVRGSLRLPLPLAKSARDNTL